MNEYEELRLSFDKLSSNPVAETVLVAAAGCLCLLLAVAGARLCPLRRDGLQRHAVVSSYSHVHGETASQGYTAGDEVE